MPVVPAYNIMHQIGRTQADTSQSQAIRANGQVFVSGQIPADASGNLVQGSIGDLTQACCDNIQAIVTAAGSSVQKIVKVNVCFVPSSGKANPREWFELFFLTRDRSSSLIWPTSPR